MLYRIIYVCMTSVICSLLNCVFFSSSFRVNETNETAHGYTHANQTANASVGVEQSAITYGLSFWTFFSVRSVHNFLLHTREKWEERTEEKKLSLSIFPNGSIESIITLHTRESQIKERFGLWKKVNWKCRHWRVV